MKGSKGATFGAVALAAVALVAAAIAAWGWVIMIGFGVVWHEFGVGKPLGFWPSVGLGIVVTSIQSLFAANKKD